MDKNTVLITGASGFIGTALIARFINNYFIIGIDKILNKDRENMVLWYKVDISDKEHLNNTFREIREKVCRKID
jgi:nucleoside-diphosphate-sugar epimerase